MALETTTIQEKLTSKFGDKVLNFHMSRDIFSFEATPDAIHEVIRTLKVEEDLNFHFLTDLCGVHYPENEASHQSGQVVFALKFQRFKKTGNLKLPDTAV